MLLVPVNRRAGFHRLVIRNEGSTSVEYAVLFGVVALSLVVGVACLGQMSKASLNATAVAIGPAGSGTAGALGQATSAGNPQDSENATAETVGIPRWQFIATGMALFVACGAPLSYAVLRPLLKKSTAPAEPETPAAVKAAPSHDEQAFAKRNQLRNIFENNMASLLEGRLKVRHVMSRQITCVRKATTVETVRDMMESKQVRHVLVTTADGALLGIISHQDCAERNGKRAADIMTTEPFSLDADSDLSPAVTMLIRRRISCLPVTSEGTLSGVVTTTDFLVALQCALHTLSNVVEHLPPPQSKRQSIIEPHAESAEQQPERELAAVS